MYKTHFVLEVHSSEPPCEADKLIGEEVGERQ